MRRWWSGLAALAVFAGAAAQAADDPGNGPWTRLKPLQEIDFDKVRTPYVVRADGLTLTFRLRKGEEGASPVVAVASKGARGVEIVGEENPMPYRSAFWAVTQLDPASRTSEVIFTSFTGGAHCCTTIDIAWLDGATWKTQSVGLFDGDAPWGRPADIDGDGIADLMVNDDRFNYAFGCYACGAAPARIFNFTGGKLTDVSRAPRYAALRRAEMALSEKDCRAGENAQCAAYVASASLAGERAAAWAVMLASYEKENDWGWPKGCKVDPGEDKPCPDGQEVEYASYPEALEAFLKRNGY